MKLVKIVIIDDEPAAVDVITELTMQFASDFEISGIAMNGVDAINLILKVSPDLVFLDVDMPLINGLQVIDKLPNKNFQIIFTTGSSSHALNAIKLQAVDYLLKPIDPADFANAVEKFRHIYQLKQTKEIENKSYRIQLSTQQGIIYLDEKDILQIAGMGSYSQVILKNGNQKYMVSKSIGQMEEKLSDNFFRCHNSHIINLHYVNSFSNKDGYFVVMKNGVKIEVSRRSKEALLKKLAEFSAKPT